MNGLLKQIQPQLNKYVQILNSILEIDVEIVDIDFIRIAGSGVYQHALDVDTKEEGHLYNSVFQNCRERIVLDILQHPICSKCDKKDTCSNKLIIAVPIVYMGEAVGVIGLISTQEDKKKYIKNRLRQYLEFVHHISDLISAKIWESQNRLLEKRQRKMWVGIVDVIDDGVVILQDDDVLLYANAIGRDLLNLGVPEDTEVVVKLLKVWEGTGSYDRMLLKINSEEMTVFGKLIAINDMTSGYSKLIIIKRLAMSDALAGEKRPQYKLLGESPQMKEINRKIERIAHSPSTVLICGESGTGKELIAQEIHRMGNRSEKPFVAVNCGAIPESLLESELFGYVKGAFTGANLAGKMGKFELANSGILFLDEIGDMPLLLQVKLLRVLQEKKLYRVGSNKVVNLDLKIIAATNKNLEELCEKGLFRVDLYYRLNVIPIDIPPLRERKEDILCLFRYFVEKYQEAFGLKRLCISPETEKCIVNYDWLGNVRELENAVEYCMNFVEDGETITPSLLPARILEQVNLPQFAPNDQQPAAPSYELSRIKTLEQMNKEYLMALLNKYGTNTEAKKQIAQMLGIGTATLYRMLK